MPIDLTLKMREMGVQKGFVKGKTKGVTGAKNEREIGRVAGVCAVGS